MDDSLSVILLRSVHIYKGIYDINHLSVSC